MKFKTKSLSIKNKILVVLSSLPLIAISIVVWMAIQVFKDDKLAYVYDSALSTTRGKASSIEAQVLAFGQSLKAMNSNYDPQVHKISENGKAYFDGNNELKGFFDFRSAEGEFKPEFSLNKEGEFKPEELSYLSQILQEAQDKGFSVGVSKQFPMHIYLAASSNLSEQKIVSLLMIESENFFSLFGEENAGSSFLYHPQFGALLGPADQFSGLERYLANNVYKKSFTEGAKEVSLNNKEYLTSYSKVSRANLYVVSIVDREQALIAVKTLMRRSLLFSGVILCVLVFLGVIAANSLTQALRGLAQATTKIMEGDFTVRVENENGDEIGLLAQSFNKMTEEVSRLMEQTAQNARMEAELQTAQTVQDTLFPPNDAHIGPISIYGKSIPASECGGDWWHYSDRGGRVFVWIGDATGHGVPAALLTSAARAVASVIEGLPDVTPSQALSMMNQAIHSTSKGQMMMTFFLACIDFENNKLTYCNASHDPPYLLSHAIEGEPKRKDYEPLMDVNSPRLGESPESTYKDHTIDFLPGDKLICYTDGIVDVKSPEGDLYGERRFLKALSGIVNSKVDVIVNNVFDNFNDFRQATPLDDDVTLILVEFEGESKAS